MISFDSLRTMAKNAQPIGMENLKSFTIPGVEIPIEGPAISASFGSVGTVGANMKELVTTNAAAGMGKVSTAASNIPGASKALDKAKSEATNVVKSNAATDKLANVVKKGQDLLDNINNTLNDYIKKFNGFIQDISNMVNKNKDKTRRFFIDNLAKVRNKILKLIDDMEDWYNKKKAIVEQWVKDQMKSVTDFIKKQVQKLIEHLKNFI